MRINKEYLEFYIQSKGVVHCANSDELLTLIDTLQELGFKIGYFVEDNLDFLYVGFGNALADEIHAARGVRFAHDYNRMVVEFSDFLTEGEEHEILPRSIDMLF